MKVMLPVIENNAYCELLYGIANGFGWASGLSRQVNKTQSIIFQQLKILEKQGFIVENKEKNCPVRNAKIYSINWEKLIEIFYNYNTTFVEDGSHLESEDDIWKCRKCGKLFIETDNEKFEQTKTNFGVNIRCPSCGTRNNFDYEDLISPEDFSKWERDLTDAINLYNNSKPKDQKESEKDNKNKLDSLKKNKFLIDFLRRTFCQLSKAYAPIKIAEIFEDAPSRFIVEYSLFTNPEKKKILEKIKKDKELREFFYFMYTFYLKSIRHMLFGIVRTSTDEILSGVLNKK